MTPCLVVDTVLHIELPMWCGSGVHNRFIVSKQHGQIPTGAPKQCKKVLWMSMIHSMHVLAATTHSGLNHAVVSSVD